ncbi:uncharacterized protein LOC124205776 [Daphnia pulex]|uniref:uncharacterized protein LOC124205776 n=1 Tax=Daphnia pulex TaxID=6669 RepID=UPI001EDE75AA|nr:uncharacterized protein LOC124205776 [Daphnia pulex]
MELHNLDIRTWKVKNYATIDSKTSSASDDVLINKKLLKTTSRKSTKLDQPQRISSQETIITSTCECLSPHELSDFSESDESIGTTSWERSISQASQCQKLVRNRRTVCEESMNPIISKSPEKINVTQDAILIFSQLLCHQHFQ